ncbi:MAG: U32 family peptidase, partial [Lachnospiraceae bacterium]|nr:U32 family peptidase [Lachnospiraceae bacterium]
MSEIGLEVLAPAGDPEIFKRVIDAGADAVYFGGHAFGARAYATNFTLETAEESIRYAHARGKKAYLTVNTLLKNMEIEQTLYGYLSAYAQMGLDAVIVQDFGVFSMVRDFFPSLAIHCSTQMSLATPYGAGFLQQQGAHRIVTARELSLQEIKDIYDATGVEIETFVHGALCVSYSGQCLLSSMIGGRSGNRGRCAQPCRLPYDAYDLDGRKISGDGQFLLSPKDLCGIRDIPALSDAGVYSLKIEGRMKQGDYAEGVVAMYRKYVDLYASEGASNYRVSDADLEILLGLGNRKGFTNAYYYHRNPSDMITYTESAHRNQKAKGDGSRKMKTQLPIVGSFHGHLGAPMELRFSTASGLHPISGVVQGEVVSAAQKQAAREEDVRAKLIKTGNTPFVFSELTIDLDENIFLPATQLNELRRQALDQLEQLLVMVTPPEILPYEEVTPRESSSQWRGDFATVRTMEQCEEVIGNEQIRYIGLDTSITFTARDELSSLLARIHASNQKAVCMMPMIFRRDSVPQVETLCDGSTYAFDAYMATTMDALGFLYTRVPSDQIWLDERLYTYSNRAIASYEGLGIT